MKKFKILNVVLLSLSVILISSCGFSHSFVRTGNHYPALGENEAVKVIFTDENINGFTEIGIIELKERALNNNSSLADAVDKAKEIAREMGANCIVYMKIDKQIAEVGEMLTTQKSYYFRAGKIVKAD